MVKFDYKYLENINSPEDLKKLSVEELGVYCTEVRDFLIRSLAHNPGHFASSLGVVELTVAIHYVFDTPADKLIWDVGHQAYTHKVITGRREEFARKRTLGGISGFPRMAESPYDSFGGGHASVSVSAALGMAKAEELQGGHNKVVAVIGDGALTGGLAFEGLNNAGVSHADLLVVLNDNNMAISPNVGAMKDYLLSITTSEHYNRVKTKTWNALAAVPGIRRSIQRAGRALKRTLLQQSNLFEALNFRYFGPVDGHDVKTMVKVLSDLKKIGGPKLLHVITVKGKGFEPAENDAPAWHAPGKFDCDTGERLDRNNPDLPARYQDVFGHTLVELAEKDKRVVGITPAMLTGCSMNYLMDAMPDRCFDVGIAEGHAVTFSAGLAADGMVPFCNIYSSFMQRAYDNVIHDVALQNLHVVFCLDRAGVVGEDGATHHGAFDLAFLRPIPNMIVAAPRNEAQLRSMMYLALDTPAPFAIRYPRGRGDGSDWHGPIDTMTVGQAEVLRQGDHAAVLTIGNVSCDAMQAAEELAEKGVSVEVVDMRFVKPLDEQVLHSVAGRFGHIVTVEDGTIEGGLGSAVLEFLADNGYTNRVTRLGIGDSFVPHGTIAQLHHLCGYDAQAIVDAVEKSLED